MAWDGIKVHKRFELRAHDERELQHRINTFQQALRVNCGRIMEIRHHRRSAPRGCRVTVLYQVRVSACARQITAT